MERVAKVISEAKLIVWLLVRKPESDWLEFHGKGSDMYMNVTKWCNLEKDLKETTTVYKLDPKLDSEIVCTDNSIIFDKRKEAFVELNDTFNDETPKLFIDLADELEDEVKYDVTLIDEKTFTEQEWKELVSIGATSRVFELESRFIA